MSRRRRKSQCKPWAERKLQTIERAQIRRIELLQILSPDRRCAHCGKRKRSYDGLEIDHKNGRTWNLEKVNRWSRIARYWREYEAGVPLQALCRSCNGKDGRARQLKEMYLQRRYARDYAAYCEEQEAA